MNKKVCVVSHRLSRGGRACEAGGGRRSENRGQILKRWNVCPMAKNMSGKMELLGLKVKRKKGMYHESRNYFGERPDAAGLACLSKSGCPASVCH